MWGEPHTRIAQVTSPPGMVACAHCPQGAISSPLHLLSFRLLLLALVRAIVSGFQLTKFW